MRRPSRPPAADYAVASARVSALGRGSVASNTSPAAINGKRFSLQTESAMTSHEKTVHANPNSPWPARRKGETPG
jgi:hypothetical protein